MKRKIIIECQKDVKDCGPCCLSSIIKFYDGYVPLEKSVWIHLLLMKA